jgi:hypothetical protein
VSSELNKRNPRAVARVLHDLLLRSSEIKKSYGNAWRTAFTYSQKNLRDAQHGQGSEQVL